MKQGDANAKLNFPLKLHRALVLAERDNHGHIFSWLEHGRAFKVHKREEFIKTILPNYLDNLKYDTFLRHCNLYGFRRLTKASGSVSRHAVYHELFLKGREYLAFRMRRTKVNGNGVKPANRFDREPKFFDMPFCTYFQTSENHENVVTHDEQGSSTNIDVCGSIKCISDEPKVHIESSKIPFCNEIEQREPSQLVDTDILLDKIILRRHSLMSNSDFVLKNISDDDELSNLLSLEDDSNPETDPTLSNISSSSYFNSELDYNNLGAETNNDILSCNMFVWEHDMDANFSPIPIVVSLRDITFNQSQSEKHNDIFSVVSVEASDCESISEYDLTGIVK